MQTVDRTVDSLRERFGNGSVFRSSFINSGVRFRSGGTVDDEEYRGLVKSKSVRSSPDQARSSVDFYFIALLIVDDIIHFCHKILHLRRI